MPSYETSVEIVAAPAEVWAATCDIESWPDWSPTMDEVTRKDSGPIGPGSAAVVRQPKLRPATWVVDEVSAERNFTWHTGGPGYRITAIHLFEPSAGGTRVTLTAQMAGPLASVLWAVAGRTTRRYLDQEAAGLKQHCEHQS